MQRYKIIRTRIIQLRIIYSFLREIIYIRSVTLLNCRYYLGLIGELTQSYLASIRLVICPSSIHPFDEKCVILLR
jgi:hypothetical protein